MRRILAILLMLLVPLQFAWSAAQGVHGHMDGDVSILGFHSHDSDHDHREGGAPGTHDEFLAGSGSSCDGDAGHPGEHYHPIFISLVLDADLALRDASPGGPPIPAPATFTSHTPPLIDWPPSARS